MARRAAHNRTLPRPEVLGLLQAAKEAPEEDAPRLILADWLEEHGGPADLARAEFVRAEIELARLPGEDPRRPEWGSRSMKLQARHQGEWLGPLYKLASCWFWRGLLSIEIRPGQLFSRVVTDWMEGEDAAWLTGLRVNGLTMHGARRLARRPFLAGITSLGVRGDLGDAGVVALAASPHLSSLRCLELGSNYLQDAGVQALASSPHLANLTRLSLSFTAVGSPGAATLANSPHLDRLADLDLTANGSLPETEGAAALRRRFGDRVRFRPR